MNRSRVLPVAVSLTAAAALLLTGCGGGDDKDSGDKIAGAGDGKKKESPSASASSGAKIDRPDIKLPSDLKLTVKDPNLSDPDQSAAWNDARNYTQSIAYGIVKQDAEGAAYKFYSEYGGPSFVYAKDQIKKNIAAGFTITGERSIENVTAKTITKHKNVVVTFCTDDTKYFSKEVKTKKVHQTKPSVKDYSFWQVSMKAAKSNKGLWRADRIKVEANAQQCKG
ncbi:hypothetical protein [Streptomyces sp. NPDC059009]|uniref:hypothetical protein n=1 Tax=Streptomyces sp. NPDC059009 TaxID=3346694 RepID=UPI0036CD132F